MRTNLSIPIFAAALALLAFSAGCGGGSDGSGTTGAGSATTTGAAKGPKTEAQLKFIKEANALCSKADAEFEVDVKPYVKHDLQAIFTNSAVIVNKVVAPGIEAMIGQIRALGPPPGDSPQIEALLTALHEVAEHAKAEPKEFMEEGFSAYEESKRLASEYGIEACGNL
jgi:hypothetical protein